MGNATKKAFLTAAYFPFQVAIGIILSPLLVLVYAYAKSEDMAFDDVYLTEDNPMLNQDGPAMQAKRRHCWLVRFFCPIPLR